MNNKKILETFGLEQTKDKIVVNKTKKEFFCIIDEPEHKLYKSDNSFLHITKNSLIIQYNKYNIHYYNKEKSLIIENGYDYSKIQINEVFNYIDLLSYGLEIFIYNRIEETAYKKIINDLRKILSTEILPSSIISYYNLFCDEQELTNNVIHFIKKYVKDYDEYDEYIKEIIMNYFKYIINKLINFRKINSKKIIGYYEKQNQELENKIVELNQRIEDNNRTIEETKKVKRLK